MVTKKFNATLLNALNLSVILKTYIPHPLLSDRHHFKPRIVRWLALFLFFGYCIASNADQFRSERELAALKAEIARLQEKFKLDQDKEQTLLSDLEAVERKLVLLNQQKRDKLLKLESLRTEKMVLSKQLYDLGLKGESARIKLKAIAKFSYVLSQQDSIKLALNQKNPAKIARNLTIHRYILTSRKKQIDDIRALQHRYQTTAEQIERQQDEIDQTLVELKTQEQDLQQTEETRQIQLALVKQDLSEGGSQIKVYQQQEEELQQLLAHLQRNKRDKSLALSNKKSEQGTIGSKKPSQVLDGGGFYKNKGNLPLPAKAGILNRYGEIRKESGLFWEGLMFDVNEGQNVVAIYSGQVVFSDWFQGYGQLLVLDHGAGYMSLYGHNQLLHSEVGNTVSTGELIALAGSTGGLDKPGLYFEVRHNGTPDDPLKWCRL